MSVRIRLSPQFSTVFTSLIVVLSSIILNSCTSRYRLYSGPPKPIEEIALLVFDSKSRSFGERLLDHYPADYVDVTLLNVDGEKCPSPEVITELLPGSHTVTALVTHFDAVNVESAVKIGRFYEANLTLKFNAEAGRIYKIEGVFGPCVESGWTLKRFDSQFGMTPCLHARIEDRTDRHEDSK